MFKNLFKKKEVAPTAPEALQKLRETEDMLTKKQEFVEQKVAQELQNAKTYGTRNKRLALQALRRKKQLEKQLAHIDGVLLTISHQKESLENASVNAEVLDILAQSSKALKGAHNNMDIDKVHDLMEEIDEQRQVADEIAEAISNPIGISSGVDDDELLAELEKLEEEDLERQLHSVPSGPSAVDIPKLPDAPTTSLSGKTKTKEAEQDEMATLQAWADS